MVRNGTQMKELWNIEKLEALEKQKDELLANFILKATEGTVAAVTAVYAAPEVSMLVSVLLMAKNSSAGTIVGMDASAGSPLGKLGIKEANVVGQNIINYGLQLQALEGQLSAAEKKIMAEWFGKGESYQVGKKEAMSFYGFYEPKAIHALYRMEEEGLGIMAGWDEDQILEVVKEIGENDNVKEDGLEEVCTALVKGGYQLVEEVNGSYQIQDVKQFAKALNAIDRIVGNKETIPLPGGIHQGLFMFD